MSKAHNIFISWSGERSKWVAEAFKEWLPNVLQSARPWLSTHDIEKGTRSLSEMNKALGGMGLGITCLTPENLNAEWILYEAGVLSKTFDDDKSRLWTYLLCGLQNKDVKFPLAQFQHTMPQKEDTRKLIHSINGSINREEDRLTEEKVNVAFNRWWPDLDAKVKAIPKAEIATTEKRDSDDILAEILGLWRHYLPQIGSISFDPAQVPYMSTVGRDVAGPLGTAGSYAKSTKVRPFLKKYVARLRNGEMRVFTASDILFKDGTVAIL